MPMIRASLLQRQMPNAVCAAPVPHALWQHTPRLHLPVRSR